MDTSEFDEAYEDDTSRREAEERKLGEKILGASLRALSPRPAVTMSETTSIEDAVQLMLEQKIGAVLITKDARPIGIFTERDVLVKLALGEVDKSLPVSEVMTPDPETLGLDDGIAFALNRMVEHGYRHIPIVDDQGHALGVLSVRQVVAYMVSLMPGRVLNLPPEPGLEARAPDGG